MKNGLFRQLTEEEAEPFREWARKNYTVGELINEVWHPVVRAECERMNGKGSK